MLEHLVLLSPKFAYAVWGFVLSVLGFLALHISLSFRFKLIYMNILHTWLCRIQALSTWRHSD